METWTKFFKFGACPLFFAEEYGNAAITHFYDSP
jgi:hypothetical protein